ncbi:cation diffusion facilitator family transporter [Nocardioides jensenii]|uniref:cation diffusion facilitator family transporter n=1 Tax=Nocardioides jensenii TaxID=1843 RepID=UPI0009E700C1|nr:cation diffusion facilitator family transporter [Nocardioides jensenii]
MAERADAGRSGPARQGSGGTGEESRPTVILAGVANLAIAVAKLTVGTVSGSAAMLSEAAHSVADTINQGFLLTALHRSRKPADREHPFGYGMERYFWSLLAAVGIFVLGAGFSAYQGIRVLIENEPSGPPMWSYVVLAVAFLFEGTSLARGLWQLSHEASERGVSSRDHLAHGAEPALRQVVYEDGVALMGILLAAGGVALEHATGQPVWDAVASLAIAALLIWIAAELGRQNQQHLIGKAIDPEVEQGIAAEIERTPGVQALLELMTMRLSPDEVLVAARIDLAEGPTSDEFEHAADDLDARIQARYPQVRHVFVDPTSPDDAHAQ